MADIQDVIRAVTLATAVKKLAEKKRTEAASTSTIRPNVPQGPVGGSVAAPVNNLANIPQTPVVQDLIAKGLLTADMDPAQIQALISMGGLRGQIPIDLKAIMDQLNAQYDQYSGDILTAGADWMKDLYGTNYDPNDPNAALFAQDPIFSSYAGGMAQLEETSDLNRTNDLAWFDKQGAAMQGYYDMLMQQVATPATEVGGGGGGGGGGGYGGGGGGDGDSEGEGFTEGDWEKIKTAFKVVEQEQRKAYENEREDFPGYVRGIRNTFGAFNPEFAHWARNIMDTSGSDPERVADLLVDEEEAALASLDTNNQAMWNNEVFEQGLGDLANLRMQAYENSLPGDDPATEDETETDYFTPEQLANNQSDEYLARNLENQQIWLQANDPSFIPGGLEARDQVAKIAELTRRAALQRLQNPDAAQPSTVPTNVQALLGNATGGGGGIPPAVQALVGNATGATPAPAATPATPSTPSGSYTGMPIAPVYLPGSLHNIGADIEHPRGNEYGGIDLRAAAQTSQANTAAATQNFSGPDEVIRLLVGLNAGQHRNPELIAQVLRDSEGSLAPEWMDEINNWVRIHSPESFNARGNQNSTSYNANDMGPFVGTLDTDVTTPGQDIAKATQQALQVFNDDSYTPGAREHYLETVYPNLSMLQRMAVDDIIDREASTGPTGPTAPSNPNTQNVSALLRRAIGGASTATPAIPNLSGLQNIQGLVNNATGPSATSGRSWGSGGLRSPWGTAFGIPTVDYYNAVTSHPGILNPISSEDIDRIWSEGAVRDDGTVRQNVADMIKNFSSEEARIEHNLSPAQGENYIPPGVGTYWIEDAPTDAEQQEIARKLQAIAQFRAMTDAFNRGIQMVNVGNAVTDSTTQNSSLTTTATNPNLSGALLTGVGDLNAASPADVDVIPEPGVEYDYSFTDDFNDDPTGVEGFQLTRSSLIDNIMKGINMPSAAQRTQTKNLASSVKNLAQQRVNRTATPTPAPDLNKVKSMLKGVQKLGKLKGLKTR